MWCSWLETGEGINDLKFSSVKVNICTRFGCARIPALKPTFCIRPVYEGSSNDFHSHVRPILVSKKKCPWSSLRKGSIDWWVSGRRFNGLCFVSGIIPEQTLFAWFGVLAAVVMKIYIFWNIIPCNTLEINRRFGGRLTPAFPPVSYLVYAL
jgi:hypothetical protein